MRAMPEGSVPVQPGGTITVLPLAVPVVRLPSAANTSVHMSSRVSVYRRPWVSGTDSTTGPAVRSSQPVLRSMSGLAQGVAAPGWGRVRICRNALDGAPWAPCEGCVNWRRVRSIVTRG
ncbi:hypothetical protein G6F22_019056 [Rhizopus arrhizus]|nr:hypothetical protein G6F22_019056 [Rhizopus arrhizus]